MKSLLTLTGRFFGLPIVIGIPLNDEKKYSYRHSEWSLSGMNRQAGRQGVSLMNEEIRQSSFFLLLDDGKKLNIVTQSAAKSLLIRKLIKLKALKHIQYALRRNSLYPYQQTSHNTLCWCHLRNTIQVKTTS